MTEPKRPPVKASGPGGKNKQQAFILREERAGQIDQWKAAAKRAGVTITAWIREKLDDAAKR